MNNSTEQMLRYEQQRGNRYAVAFKNLIKYFINIGDLKSAGVISASFRDANADITKSLREIRLV